jgi:hypothetical protein
MPSPRVLAQRHVCGAAHLLQHLQAHDVAEGVEPEPLERAIAGEECTRSA